MKRIVTLLVGCLCVFAMKAQNGVMVANFDDVVPYEVGSWGGITIDYDAAPAGSLASGQMLVVSVPANNEIASFTISLNETLDPRDYVGVSFDGQISEADGVSFVLKLHQSSDPGHENSIQDWDTWAKYTGGGEWQNVHIPFNVVNESLDGKYDEDPDFPVDQYDQIEFQPGPWENHAAFTLNMDNVMLRYDWEEEGNGIPLTKVAAFILMTVNGTITATSVDGNPVSLKVYSISGQEIANGVNQVQVGVKGAYIVKAATGKANLVQKIIVK